MPTLAEQVAALEAERDYWRKSYEMADERAALNQRERLAAESRLASARVEGARLQREAWVDGATAVADVSGCFVCSPRARRPTTGDDAKVEYRLAGVTFAEHAARRYPAPAAPAGEPRTCGNGEVAATCNRDDCGGDVCNARPAPTPEPEALVLDVDERRNRQGEIVVGGLSVTLTPEDCRRIVALGSRPTQTAEG